MVVVVVVMVTVMMRLLYQRQRLQVFANGNDFL
jgi:hypothetical protein